MPKSILHHSGALSKYVLAKNKLARFKQRHGQYPKIGIMVDVETNENSYWNLVA